MSCSVLLVSSNIMALPLPKTPSLELKASDSSLTGANALNDESKPRANLTSSTTKKQNGGNSAYSLTKKTSDEYWTVTEIDKYYCRKSPFGGVDIVIVSDGSGVTFHPVAF